MRSFFPRRKLVDLFLEIYIDDDLGRKKQDFAKDPFFFAHELLIWFSFAVRKLAGSHFSAKKVEKIDLVSVPRKCQPNCN